MEDSNKWPNINKDVLDRIKINIVVQINGKTRDVVSMGKNADETEINELVKKSSKTEKYLKGKKIKKTIFVKNKIINYIIIDK